MPRCSEWPARTCRVLFGASRILQADHVDGTYLGNLLAPLVIMGAGLGLLYARRTTVSCPQLRLPRLAGSR
jgi:hypothetical protein